MRTIKFVLAAMAAVLAGACTTANGESASGPAAAQRNISIMLERGPCFGACPIYSVTLTNDGAVSYEGHNFVSAQGHQSAQVSPQAVEALARRFEAAHFFELRDAYRGQITDLPEYRLTLTIDGRTKTVVDYAGQLAGMPAVVHDLEEAVDALAGTARWVRRADSEKE